MPERPLIDQLPPDAQRKLNRSLFRGVARDLIRECPDNDFFAAVTAFTIQQLLDEDPDFADLEAHRAELIAFVGRLHGIRDALFTHPWTRFPRDLGYSGRLAEMTAGETKVYLALLSLCEPRTLVTCASLETIAAMAGRSAHTVSDNLTRLKRRGLIRRWCIRHPEALDECHYLWFTKIVPDGCVETARELTRLHETAAMPVGA